VIRVEKDVQEIETVPQEEAFLTDVIVVLRWNNRIYFDFQQLLPTVNKNGEYTFYTRHKVIVMTEENASLLMGILKDLGIKPAPKRQKKKAKNPPSYIG